jgi:ribonuclease HII
LAVTSDLFASQAIACGQIENWAKKQGYKTLIGLDEAGRGPLAGPVLAAAVCLPSHHEIGGLNDSKVLSEAVRESLYAEIIEQCVSYGIVAQSAQAIDDSNILKASLKAMGLAWEEAVSRRPELANALVLVDGNKRALLPGHVDQRPIVKGDARSTNIAAASILAKVTRDRMMLEAHKSWPEYGFDRHKGYPTVAHRAALAKHGPCPIHRRSFRLLPDKA